jgi:NAD(P)-dependent dehydrogenase (short-subunit alcohol dehydrogenase family)
MSQPETVLVVGVGPGLGWGLVRAFARSGRRVAAAARRSEHVSELAAAEPDLGVHAYACDATDGSAVRRLFEAVDRDLGAPRVVVFNAGVFQRAGILDLDAADLERSWRVGCLGAFHVGQAAARRMLDGGGTILFTGATASLRGGAGFAALAVQKFGLRALAQSMARELAPRGVHVAHVIIDGVIASERTAAFVPSGEDTALDPDAIARAYLGLHEQPRSAWTHELDLRPWVEKF